MSDPVDLTNLRSMTDGDTELEKSLFEEFFSSFEKEMRILQASMADSAIKDWHTKAHALKGISYNLGAHALGELCKAAQDAENASSQVKAELVEKIKVEYAKVKEFLLKLIS